MKIYCVGDSHINLFSGYDKIQPIWSKEHDDKWSIFKTYRLGSHLAYSLSHSKSKNLLILLKALSKINRNNLVFISYGEIDCRVHLLKQSILQKRKLHLIVNDCVDKYLKVLSKIVKRGYRIAVIEPVASSDVYINYQEFITFGSGVERNIVTALFNTRLRSRAKLANIPVLSVNKYLFNKDMTTNMKYYCDPIHLSAKTIDMFISEIVSMFPELENNKELKKIKSNPFDIYFFINKIIHINYYKLVNLVRKYLFNIQNDFNLDSRRERELILLYTKVYKKYLNKL